MVTTKINSNPLQKIPAAHEVEVIESKLPTGCSCGIDLIQYPNGKCFLLSVYVLKSLEKGDTFFDSVAKAPYSDSLKRRYVPLSYDEIKELTWVSCCQTGEALDLNRDFWRGMPVSTDKLDAQGECNKKSLLRTRAIELGGGIVKTPKEIEKENQKIRKKIAKAFEKDWHKKEKKRRDDLYRRLYKEEIVRKKEREKILYEALKSNGKLA